MTLDGNAVLNQTLVFDSKLLWAHLLWLVMKGPMVSLLFVGGEGRGWVRYMFLRNEGGVNVQP